MEKHMDHMKDYKGRLEKGICDYMQMPVSERSATAIHAMFKALRDIERRVDVNDKFTYDDACNWAKYMKNADGTTGAHWDIDTTESVAKAAGIDMEHIYGYDWWITLNSVYSDYCGVAREFGVDTVDFYVSMTKAFLFDPDYEGKPHEKLAAYYWNIVCKH